MIWVLGESPKIFSAPTRTPGVCSVRYQTVTKHLHSHLDFYDLEQYNRDITERPVQTRYGDDRYGYD